VYPDLGYDPVHQDPAAGDEIYRCCLFRTLMSYNGRTTEEGGTIPLPDLASGVPTVSADRRTWVFKIRTGIHYAPPLQDVEVTAADFVRALERAWSPAPDSIKKVTGQDILGGDSLENLVTLVQGADSFAAGDTSTISGLETPDAHTLQIRLTRPSGDLAYYFAQGMTAPIPPNPARPDDLLGVAQGHDTDYGMGFQVGTGPYMIEGAGGMDFSKAPADQEPASGAGKDKLTLVRNPSWDRATDPLRAALADRIVFLGTKDVPTGEKLVEAGKADMVYDFISPPDLVEHYQASPKLRDQVYGVDFDVQTVLLLNLAVPPLDDVHVRRAWNLAIDKKALVAPFRQLATTKPATHMLPNSLEDDLLANYSPYGSGEPDLEAASAEMAKSRYDKNGDGRCDRCPPVRLIVPAGDAVRLKLSELIADDLAPLGLTVHVKELPGKEWFASLTAPKPTEAATIAGLFKNLPAATTYFNGLFGFDQLDVPPARLRLAGFSVTHVPAVQDRVQACEEEVFQAQLQCWADLDQYLTEETVPWVPLLSWTAAFIVSSRVTDFSIDQSIPYPGAAIDRIGVAGP
jgi:peptide/nickel transport system substrate-binding protein